ncbi:helix-turn-helix domain-containing protein [Streptomyces sp. NBC_00249]|uniref:helix-turn-helix transcriptional regulator n=1 Tax=Streptomyces sp. NBC_00249 TaxID=2975690 RepID=UPI002258507C|nr:helix-turn-helix transcriptional regulator [Streptomyces sp. NBC_00249]MCX5194848.1 helix-turn-helix domain-containing protein [Streptomyces sp. NBC_00249]
MGDSLGEVLRQARNARRMSQGAVGKAVGYSASWVSRVESNKVRPDDDTLGACCDLLGLSGEDVGLGGNDVLHRRRMLALGLGAGLSVALPSPAFAEGDSRALVERSIFHLPEAQPVSREALVTGLAQARDLFHEAQYVRLGKNLPRLISAASASGAHDVTARAHVLLAQLAIKNHQQYAWIAADRARTHARMSGNPVIMGEAAHSMAISMRRAGEYEASVDQLQAAVSNLDERSPDHLAMRGVLLLTASYSSAQAGWKGQALGFLGEAEETASRKETETRKLYIPGVFSPDHTRLFRISVHHALGEGGEALRYASQVDPLRLPNAERRARMMMDVCRVFKDEGEPGRAFSALRAMEKYAPEEVRRPKVRAIASELLTLNGDIPGLRRFAQHIGAP